MIYISVIFAGLAIFFALWVVLVELRLHQLNDDVLDLQSKESEATHDR